MGHKICEFLCQFCEDHLQHKFLFNDVMLNSYPTGKNIAHALECFKQTLKAIDECPDEALEIAGVRKVRLFFGYDKITYADVYLKYRYNKEVDVCEISYTNKNITPNVYLKLIELSN